MLSAANQTIVELSVLERDIEEYFVELMGGADNAALPTIEPRR